LRIGKSATAAAAIALALALAGCGRKEAGKAAEAAGSAADVAPGQVSVEGDDRIAATLTWHAPEVTLAPGDLAGARKRADQALADGRLYQLVREQGTVRERTLEITFLEPGAEAYVRVGSRVSSGQTVCIIEAMKIMNEIEAEVTGVIREVCVDDAQPVEYGQVLFRVDPNG